MTIYNKLVRDKIPDIIQQSGKQYRTRLLSSEEYEFRLRKKLIEEVEEYLNTIEVEELADILEVVYALAELEGVNPEKLEQVRLKKLAEKGGFQQKILLEFVE